MTDRSVREWTKDARATEKKEQQEKVWDLWLNCLDSFTDIAVEMGFATNNNDEESKKQLHTASELVRSWIAEKRKSANFCDPPDSRQHFDVWQFAKAKGDSTYFGQMPPQVVENLLWFYTEPGQISSSNTSRRWGYTWHCT